MNAQSETRRTAPGPELRALFITRWWLMATLTAALTGLVTLVALARWSQLNTVEHLCVMAALPTAAAGIVLRRRRGSEWLFVASLALFALAALVAPVGSPPWLPLPNSASYPVFLAIMLSSRRVGLLLALALPLIITAIWADRPTNVIAGALLIGDGRIAIAQTLATSLCMWWVWNMLVRESMTADEVALERERRTARSLVLLERARLWRTAAASMHESVLNSIRSVLGAAALDRVQLASELDRQFVPPDEQEALLSASMSRLLHEVADDPLFPGSMTVDAKCPDVEMTPEVYSAARNMLISLARAAVERRGAALIALHADDLAHRTVRIVFTARKADGSVDAMPAALLAPALLSALQDAGGSAATNGTRTEITLPVGRASGQTPARGYEPFDKGRLMVTAVLAGSITIGVAYLAILIATYGEARATIAGIAGLAGCASAVVVVLRRQRVPRGLGYLLILAPAAVPWILLGTERACTEGPTIAPAVNIAGFSVVVIAAWAGRYPGAMGVLLWAAGAAAVAASFPAGCREAPALALLNSLLLIPVALQVTYAGVRSYERAALKLAEVRRRELVGVAAAQTAIDLNTTLYSSVGEAVELLGAVASGTPVDGAMRRDLRLVDARIRAAMQVDPASAGAFAALAKDVVETAAAQGVPVQVRALAGSEDQRPLPLEFRLFLNRAVTGSHPVEPVIQVFSDGTLDYLTLIVGSGGLEPTALSSGQSMENDSAVLNLLDEGDELSDAPSRASIVLTRPVRTADDPIVVP